jgi:hypothetical protein
VASPSGAETSLGSVLEDIDSVDEDLVLFTRGEEPVTCDTPAVLVEDEDDAPADSRYLLEVFLIKDVLSVWSQWRQGAEPTLQDKSAAVLHYATHDAYLPVPPPT